MFNPNHSIYPYTWNADSVAVELHDGKEMIGSRLNRCFISPSLYIRVNPSTVLGMPVNSVKSIRVLKRGQWYSIPVSWRRPKI